MNIEKYLNYLVQWLQEVVKKTNTKGLILGISGGIDSALVAYLVKKAMGDNCLGVIMPCHSSFQDEIDAKKVIEGCKISYITLDLSDTFDQIKTSIELTKVNLVPSLLAQANIKPRLRMTSLYAIAQINNYLVVGTDNKDEWYTGYFTKHGDGGVDIAPIIHLTKSQVYEASRFLGIHEDLLKKAPSAGLIHGQTDEMELQVTYQELDAYLNGEAISEQSKQRIEKLHAFSEHKRNLALRPNDILINKKD